jgi:hypothetical protein
VIGGSAFVLLGTLGTKTGLVPAESKVPLFLFASLMFLSAYLMSLIIRIGDEYSVWPGVDANIE